ncbi:NUDIX domain-containing protein [Streptomyces sp. BK205]|uniref:NUDIX domain-containing protein n=1 Tax=Streptomyces sp. BK205 TaxID=2512164 RepID=UPI00104FE13A|nr:NUDIX domain-containing protein [Streptomyces sp. BK205]TCR22937.1 ADP-ribose pyrophosphatase YjhB (NUDIX family) [Streptomyces sp. BK205]
MSEEKQDPFQNPPPRRVGVHALITRGTQLLVVSRPYSVAVSRWGLPGGSAAANELPRRALCRHLDERLSLRASAGRILVIDHVPEQPGLHREGTNYVYEVLLPDDAEPTVTKSGRFGEARWVERAEVSNYVVDHSLRRIEQSLLASETGLFAELLLGVPLHSNRATTPTAKKNP